MLREHLKNFTAMKNSWNYSEKTIYERRYMASFTLCWTCAKATGNCDWSREGIPIEDWKANIVKSKRNGSFDTYMVISCPKYECDSYDGGVRRTKKEIKLG